MASRTNNTGEVTCASWNSQKGKTIKISNSMNFLTSLFDYTENGNLRDGFFNEFILAFGILWLSSLIGLFLGWLMWRNCKKKCDLIETEKAKIRAKQSTI